MTPVQTPMGARADSRDRVVGVTEPKGQEEVLSTLVIGSLVDPHLRLKVEAHLSATGAESLEPALTCGVRVELETGL